LMQFDGGFDRRDSVLNLLLIVIQGKIDGNRYPDFLNDV